MEVKSNITIPSRAVVCNLRANPGKPMTIRQLLGEATEEVTDENGNTVTKVIHERHKALDQLQGVTALWVEFVNLNGSSTTSVNLGTVEEPVKVFISKTVPYVFKGHKCLDHPIILSDKVGAIIQVTAR